MIAIVLWAIRILVLMLVARYVLQALFGRRPVPAQRPSARQAERVGGTLVRCAQCGTYVPEGSAITTGRGPAVRQFCSAGCRDKWEETH